MHVSAFAFFGLTGLQSRMQTSAAVNGPALDIRTYFVEMEPAIRKMASDCMWITTLVLYRPQVQFCTAQSLHVVVICCYSW
jgi:hypothetical protein